MNLLNDFIFLYPMNVMDPSGLSYGSVIGPFFEPEAPAFP